MDIRDFNKLYNDIRNPSVDEFGEQQTGDKRIPLYQNIKPGHDVYESMPVYEMGIPSLMDQQNTDFYFQQQLAYGGDVGYQYGGGAIGYSNGGLAPITAGMSIAPGYARGGYISQGQPVNTNLTRTIPPVRGPNPQGVETLFKRRYS
jgi:hypothetical protein